MMILISLIMKERSLMRMILVCKNALRYSNSDDYNYNIFSDNNSYSSSSDDDYPDTGINVLINIHLTQFRMQSMGKRDKQIVRQGAGRVQPFQKNGNGLGFGSPNNNRNSTVTIRFGQYQSIRSRLYLTVGQTQYFQLNHFNFFFLRGKSSHNTAT